MHSNNARCRPAPPHSRCGRWMPWPTRPRNWWYLALSLRAVTRSAVASL
jgi:hypothetical protein